jgi:hypothetical protein
MNDPRQFSPDELALPIDDLERDALADVAERLIRECPAPRAGFRGELRAHLSELRSRGRPRARPRWLWQRAGALVLCGGGLLGLVGLGLSGAGPFAA